MSKQTNKSSQPNKKTKFKDYKDPFSTWFNSLTQQEKISFSGKYVAIDLETHKLTASGESFTEVYNKVLELNQTEQVEVAMVPNVFF